MASSSEIDLGGLAVDRAPQTPLPPKRKWLIRYGVPGLVLFGFAGLMVAAAGKSLLPRESVTVTPVLVKQVTARREGETLFQAAGWIEPRPTAIDVASLTSGIVEDLLVVEGQLVEAGQPIARLISVDAELAVELAKAQLAIRQGELARVTAERDAAQQWLDNPTHLQVELADAESLLAKANTEVAKLPFLISAEQARVDYAALMLESKEAARAVIATRTLDEAKAALESAKSDLGELRRRGESLQGETTALESKVAAIKTQLKLLVEEKRQLAEAQAKVRSSTALCEEARIQVRQAELGLQRTVIRAPIAGRILELVGSPGTRVIGLNANESSEPVVRMYDPLRLQVRADVRLEDVPLVTEGQTVQIQTASASELIEGRVLQITSSANIQKNTLEVKVELIDPPDTVRPEMLVTATFLAAAMPPGPDDSQVRGLLIPSRLVNTDQDHATVWLVNSEGLAERRTISLGRTMDRLTEVTDGLNATDKLITSDTSTITDGAAIDATIENATQH